MPAQPDPATARILQIGRSGSLNGLFPVADRFDLSLDSSSSDAVGGLAAVARAIRSGQYDLIVSEPNYHGPLAMLARRLFSRRALLSGTSPLRPLALQLLRGRVATPLAVVDLEDPSVISACDRYLLDRSTLYFKRELPVDQWRVFSGAFKGAPPRVRFRVRSRHRANIAKLMPLSLGIANDLVFDHLPAAKTTDVFYAANTEGLPARERAMAELRALAGQGVHVDISDRRLERPEFYARCASAHLVVSPEGHGWDCFRHYEAAACGSVPLMNLPSILRYRPFTHGVDGLYYAPEPGGLTAAVLEALADRSRLLAMGQAARRHALSYHRREAIGRYIVEATLARRAEV